MLKFYSDMPVLDVCFHNNQMLNRPFQYENSFFSIMGKFLELILLMISLPFFLYLLFMELLLF